MASQQILLCEALGIFKQDISELVTSTVNLRPVGDNGTCLSLLSPVLWPSGTNLGQMSPQVVSTDKSNRHETCCPRNYIELVDQDMQNDIESSDKLVAMEYLILKTKLLSLDKCPKFEDLENGEDYRIG